MEEMILDQDIKVFCVTARSFPEGVLEAHQQLHALVPLTPHRKYFGLSRPENRVITYKAAAEEIEQGEGERLNCESLIIKKGKYISITINDFMKDIQSIGRSFQQLLSYRGLDPEGYCVEWYLNDNDVKCMVRLSD